MTSTELTFDQRLRLLARKHRRMSQDGVVRRIRPDGLITLQPRRALPRFPWRPVVLLLVAAFLFKVFLFAWLGAADYSTRLDTLRAGTVPEQGMAWLLQPEPATLTLAPLLAAIWQGAGPATVPAN